MDLEITNENNFYEVKGSLHKDNIYLFKRELSHIFDKQNTLTLNIENLKSIDRYGVSALAQLHNASITQGKKLSIVGMGCDDLYEDFRTEETSA